MTTGMPDEETVREALRQVDDPETGMNIVDLGLVYGVDVASGAVRVDMTMTTAACSLSDLITARAQRHRCDR
jgi:metal-sulfur cluster biosynthetic enzyme